MKNTKTVSLLALAALITGMAACTKDEQTLPSRMNTTELKYTVTQNTAHNNTVYLKSLTNGVIPYWDFDGGPSQLATDTVIFPFSGQYWVKYGSATGGGFVWGDSTKITVTNTDLSSITDPTWGFLTNGQAGKSWVLDMSAPVGWYGMDYKKGSGDDWSWHPDYAGNSWVMPNLNYGFMTFDLNGSKNYIRHLYKVNGADSTISTGKFNLDLPNKKISLVGAELLFGGSYYAEVSNWSSLKILDISATSMTLGVVRDKGAGLAYVGFKYKIK